MNFTKIVGFQEDGTEVVLFPIAAPVPATDPVVEVDVKTEAGVEETFVPAQ